MANDKHRLLAGTSPAALAMAGLLIVSVITFIAARAGMPSDLTVAHMPRGGSEDGAVVASILGAETGLRPGDLVIAIDGRKLTEKAGPRPSVGQELRYTLRRGGRVVDVPVVLQPYPLHQALAASWSTMAFAALLLVLGGFVFVRRPVLPAARVLFMIGCLYCCSVASLLFGLQVLDVAREGMGWWLFVGGVLAAAFLWPAVIHFALVFPEPKPLLRRHPALLTLVYGLPLAFQGTFVLVALGKSSTWERAGLIARPIVLAELVLPWVAGLVLLHTYRTTSDPSVRRQIRWVVVAFGLGAALYVGIWLVPSAWFGRPLLPAWMSPLAVAPSLLAFAAAVLRYQLFDIEVVLRRSLLYAGLTLCLFAVYATTVAVVDRLFRGGHTWASLAATALVAVLFAPLRQRLQQAVSRLLYGERDHPDVVISHLSRRLEETPLPEQVLPQVVETVAEALRLPYVGIDLLHPSGREPAARYGEPVGTPLSLPLTYQGETIGWMLFGERARGEPFGNKDRRLLEDLARHIGAAAYAVRVTAELQRSREELVRAREEERRRLRRDLHDGLGPTLAAGILQLQVALDLIRTDPDAAERILSRLAFEAKRVVEDIRRLVEALRPPALDQLGLVCAIQEQASHFGRPRRDEAHSGTLQVKVEADGDLQGLPAAVEVAAYRIVCEALNNASRHGGASVCSVRLSLWDEALEVEVLDDGRGLAADHRGGVGLASMRERAAELGGTCVIASAPSGGTVVRARLPLPTP